MTMTVENVTSALLSIVVAVVLAIVTKFVIPALKSYVEEHRNTQIYSLIETAVRAAEQTILGTGQGAVKKEQVVDLVTKWLAEKGITISAEQLDQMIEECVYLMKNPS